MAKGGARRGAGRKAGGRNRATIERELRARAGVAAALNGGPLPLDVILAKMNGDPSITDGQFQAAVAAAPYVHPRLASTDTTVKSDNVHRVISDEPMTAEEWAVRYATPANDAVSSELPEDQRDAS